MVFFFILMSSSVKSLLSICLKQDNILLEKRALLSFLIRLKVSKPHLTKITKNTNIWWKENVKKKNPKENKHWGSWQSVGFSVTSKPAVPSEPSILWRSSPRSGDNQAALCCIYPCLRIIMMGQWAGEWGLCGFLSFSYLITVGGQRCAGK